MSIRAYRVNSIDCEKRESFNLSFWHQEKVLELLDEETRFFDNLNADGIGLTEVPVEVLEEAVAKKDELELKEWVVENLKEDIEWGKKFGNGYVIYYCF